MEYRIKEEFLKELLEAPSPSGFEQPAQRIWKAEVSKYAAVRSDVMGNAVGVVSPDNRHPNYFPLRVMLSGHCDEIGLLVRYISDEGFIYVTGTIEPSILQGQRLNIHAKKGKVLGVAGKKPVHLQKEGDSSRPKIENIWLDIGAKNKKEASELVEIGDPVTFAAGYERLMNGLAVSRGFDDKIGSFIVAETLRHLSENNEQLKAAVCGVSSVQEEVGCRGVRPITFDIDPQVAIIIDVTHAADSPAVSKSEFCEIKLGQGPVISRGVITNPVVFEKLTEAAKDHNIPYQIEPAAVGMGTETYIVQLCRSGIATALVSVPNRYMHTPVEIISLEDAKNTVMLLAEFILKLDGKMSFNP